MTLDPSRVAQRLGANHVGRLPHGDGAFGAARLAAILRERLQVPRRSGLQDVAKVRWVLRPKVPMSRETEDLLILLAQQLSTPERRVNPMELAAQLLEETVQKLTRPE